MTKNLANINIQTDTFQNWLVRTNQIIDVLRNEVLTANSAGGSVGSAFSPLKSNLFGTFTANTINAGDSFTVGTGVSANNTHVVLGGTRLSVNGSFGSTGQVLTSNGSGLFWSTIAGGGSVSKINSGDGLEGGPITSSGTLKIKVNSGMIANSSGLYLEESYIRNLVGANTSVSFLLGKTWGDPGPIGDEAPNTGTFSVVTATTGYKFGNTNIVTSLGIRSPGFIEVTNSQENPAIRIKTAPQQSTARIELTSNENSSVLSSLTASPTVWTLSSDFKILQNVSVGYRIIPQVEQNVSATMIPENISGMHLYKTSTNAITLTIPDNSAEPTVIGTTITIVNDGATGNITLVQGGNTRLQLAGTFNQGSISIAPGGIATIIKIQADKWIISGVGVS